MPLACQIHVASRVCRILWSTSRHYAVVRLRRVRSRNRCQHRRQCSSKSIADSRRIDPPDVRQLAKMAHLSVTDEEVKEWEPQLAKIVDWFAQLQAVNVEGVPPALRADLSDENVTRPDEAVKYQDRNGLLKEVPEMEGELVKVPKIL